MWHQGPVDKLALVDFALAKPVVSGLPVLVVTSRVSVMPRIALNLDVSQKTGDGKGVVFLSDPYGGMLLKCHSNPFFFGIEVTSESGAV